MPTKNWYDKFAPFYDVGTIGDFFYKRARKHAIENLCLATDSRVIDVFCGTGVDFELFQTKIGAKGHITAVDGSEGMLSHARQQSRKLGIKESNISFLQLDLSAPNGIEELCASIREHQPDSILFSLGLTCLSNWSEFTSKVFDAAAPGTTLAIMDVYSKKLSTGARFINWIGSADCQRPVWKELEGKCQSFSWEEFRPFKPFDVSVIVASGIKPSVV